MFPQIMGEKTIVDFRNLIEVLFEVIVLLKFWYRFWKGSVTPLRPRQNRLFNVKMGFIHAEQTSIYLILLYNN